MESCSSSASKSGRRVWPSISQQKTALSWIQRGFLSVFEQHMRTPNQKAVSEFTAKLKKSDYLFDCLLVYVEVSQKAPDDDPNSLIVFFGVSFQAVGLGDSTFAAKYESLVTSEGTIWKRRYDALNTWQRDEKLKPAIDEKKKIAIEKRGKIKTRDKETGKEEEKEVVVQEKFTVPHVPHVPADLEGPRPSPPVTARQREFVAQYKKLMDSPTTKPASFTEYIFKLTGPELVECVEAYLLASIEYGDKNERSLYIFFGTASLAIRKADAYYAFKFEAGKKTAGTLLATRFEALNTDQKKTLNQDIEIKRKQARILDDLKLAYFQKEKKEPTLQALREFDFVAKSDQFDLLSKALDGINRAFKLYLADDFSKRFDALSSLLGLEPAGERVESRRKIVNQVLTKMEPLLFVTLLRRCREAKGVGPTLRHQLYWFMVGILYLQALRARPEAYKTGFSSEEKLFLFDAEDTGDPYFPDFAIRLDYVWRYSSGPAQFSQSCKGYMGLLLFAAKIGARLVPMVEMAVVRGVVEKLSKEKPQAIENIRIPVNSRHDVGKTLRIYQTVGKIFIVWWEPNLGAYIEHEGLDGVLFRVDSYDWLGRVYDNDAIWGEVYRSTEYLLVVIPFIFELLVYLPDLVTGGITGLAKSIFINIAIEHIVDGLGLNANVVQLALLGAGLIAHHVSPGRKGAATSNVGTEFLESERGTAGKLLGDGGTRNKLIEPPPAPPISAADHGATQGRLADHDTRGIVGGDAPTTPPRQQLALPQGGVSASSELTALSLIDPNAANIHAVTPQVQALAAELQAIEGVLAKRFGEMRGFTSAWNQVATSKADRIRRVQGLFESNLSKREIAVQARDTFNELRVEFWRYVGSSNDLAAREVRDQLSHAGFRVPTDGTAPSVVITTSRGVHEFKLDVDHIAELSDQPAKAFSASNFRLAPSEENRIVLNQLHMQDPHLPDARYTSGRGTSRSGKLTGDPGYKGRSPQSGLLTAPGDRGLHEAAAADVQEAIEEALRRIDLTPRDVF
jgi:hypothetical protein